ncbi:Squamosa promoter-binding-like protein 9, partial [Tetrabaena socialis]
ASMVMRDGIEQRFCQQCGRFHGLTEFDGTKRSCRARLQRHNARRRKRPDQRGGDGGSDEPRKAVLQLLSPLDGVSLGDHDGWQGAPAPLHTDLLPLLAQQQQLQQRDLQQQHQHHQQQQRDLSRELLHMQQQMQMQQLRYQQQQAMSLEAAAARLDGAGRNDEAADWQQQEDRERAPPGM